MTAKETLNKIRGWFPQEPYRISSRLKVNYEYKQPPPTIMPNYNVSATKTAGVFAIFWIILYGFLFSFILNLKSYPVSALQIVAWVAVGLAVGIISAMLSTVSQLHRLLKDYQFFPNGRDMVLIIVPIVLFFIFGFIVSLYVPSSIMHPPTFQGFIFSVYAWGVSIQITRYILFFAFERKEKMRLMQSWWGVGIILIPKAPESNVNRTEINPQNKI